MKSRIFMLCCAGVSTLWVGCGAAPATYYYTIRDQGPSASQAVVNGPRLGVSTPSAAHLLRQDRIVYFIGATEVNHYPYRRWAEPPVFMVQALLVRRLAGLGLFRDVVPYQAQEGLDFVLRGRLVALEEVDQTPNDIIARCGLELELVRQDKGQVVWTGRTQRERPVGDKTVEAVVAALNVCVAEALDELSASLCERVVELEKASATEKEESR